VLRDKAIFKKVEKLEREIKKKASKIYALKKLLNNGINCNNCIHVSDMFACYECDESYSAFKKAGSK